jgi:hypothetical protein
MSSSFLIFILLQLLYSIGSIVAIGFLIAWLNRIFYTLLGASSERVCYITGAIGTPIHELGHAFFCIIFRHKIKEIKLYKLNSSDGTLGYVNHAWNPKNYYQCVGNFFIGIGPILFGSAVLVLLMGLLIPDTFNSLHNHLNVFVNSTASGNGSIHLSSILKTFGGVFVDFFQPANWLQWRWWIYVILGCFIALHVNLSKPDIQGAFPGALLFAVFVAGANPTLSFFGEKILSNYHHGFLTVCMFLTGIMLLCLLFSLVAILVAFIVSKIKKHR